jgi:phosphatidyl-myo-inositol dimannoside synthase
MKILLVTEHFPPEVGGTPDLFLNIYRNLAASHPVHVLAGLGPEGAAWSPPAGMTVTRLRLGRRADRKPFEFVEAIVRGWWRGCEIVSREGITQVHCGRPYPEGLIGLLLAKRKGIPFWCYAHGEELSIFRRYRMERAAIRKVFEATAGVIANSRYTARLAEECGAARERVRVIHPGMDPALVGDSSAAAPLPAALRSLQGRPVLLTVGRLERRKGHDSVLRALPRLLARYPDLVYVIAGDGEERGRLMSLADELSLSCSVRFAGYVPEKELRYYFEACTLFVHPNREPAGGSVEGFGIVFVQAGAFGKAVIGGRSGGAVDAVIEGKTGLLVGPGDDEELYEAIERLLSDELLRDEMGRAGRSRALGELTWDRVAARVEAFCNDPGR